MSNDTLVLGALTGGEEGVEVVLEAEHYNYTEMIQFIAKDLEMPIASVRAVAEKIGECAQKSLLSEEQHFNFGKWFTLELKDIAAGKVRNPRAKPGESNQFYQAPERKKLRVRAASYLENNIKRFFNIGDSVALKDEEGDDSGA